MIELSAKTKDVIEILFGAEKSKLIKNILLNECSTNLPGCAKCDQDHLERIWLSVLKLSNGKVSEMERAVKLAKTDYRDLFMEAGFDYDLEAHKNWQP
ncbi:hypothetical protein [Zooshikella harenae]|uniref:Uncharacterized protein n=1 Tax=Zooshikella harenae TaxID=2827238 RepID=A0ABS5ZIF8_9GAMM|nr:hypothetical protein [Zooshikella harenae]MBU2713822.1 hypothetical protein [Zooshikella harenae]